LKFQAIAENTAKDARGYFILPHPVDPKPLPSPRTPNNFVGNFSGSPGSRRIYISAILTENEITLIVLDVLCEAQRNPNERQDCTGVVFIYIYISSLWFFLHNAIVNHLLPTYLLFYLK